MPGSSDTNGGDIVELGRIGAPHGVRGWVRVHSDTRPPRNILRYRTWLLQVGDTWRPHEVAEGQLQGKGLIARLRDCDDRDAAEILKGTRIAVHRSRLPPLETGEYYWTDLYGLRVEALDGTDLGRVDHLLETGANDVLVVRGDRERLIPFLPGRVVLEIDQDAGRLRVDWDPEF